MCGLAINQEEGRKVRRTLIAVGFCLATVLGVASQARAALLTLTDIAGGTNTVWTLNVPDACTSCTVTLTGTFNGPGTNNYANTFLDAVMWVVNGQDPQTVSLQSGAPGGSANWTTSQDTSISNAGCTGGETNAVCSDFAGNGFSLGAITGTTLTWQYSVTFASAVTATTGNIRAEFNTADGGNAGIFSPGGGTFTGGTGTGTSTSSGTTLVPEPTSLLLFGSGLSMAAYRARRRKQNQKK
jgi:PEP-CTERM motif